MQKLYDFKAVTTNDYPHLKKLWCDVFGDSPESVERFFSKTAEPEKIIAAFCDGVPVSVLYLIESTVIVSGAKFPAYYVYAVCTHPVHRGKGLMKKCIDMAYRKAVADNFSYLYLVPADKKLFDMYESLGFKTGFCYRSVVENKSDYNSFVSSCSKLSYKEYLKYREQADYPSAVLGEKAFSSFFDPAGESLKVISVRDEGYAVAECEDGNVTVHEVFGNRDLLLSGVFELSGYSTLTVREPSQGDGVACGMYMITGDAPEINDGFFGIPYGG